MSIEQELEQCRSVKDFLVNNFGVDERPQTSDKECREMLVHIMDVLLEDK